MLFVLRTSSQTDTSSIHPENGYLSEVDSRSNAPMVVVSIVSEPGVYVNDVASTDARRCTVSPFRPDPSKPSGATSRRTARPSNFSNSPAPVLLRT
jgi:hypothetical protein